MKLAPARRGLFRTAGEFSRLPRQARGLSVFNGFQKLVLSREKGAMALLTSDFRQ